MTDGLGFNMAALIIRIVLLGHIVLVTEYLHPPEPTLFVRVPINLLSHKNLHKLGFGRLGKADIALLSSSSAGLLPGSQFMFVLYPKPETVPLTCFRWLMWSFPGSWPQTNVRCIRCPKGGALIRIIMDLLSL